MNRVHLESGELVMASARHYRTQDAANRAAARQPRRLTGLANWRIPQRLRAPVDSLQTDSGPHALVMSIRPVQGNNDTWVIWPHAHCCASWATLKCLVK
jgi:hypothetical protein